jgi:hypothetical protein
MFDVLFGGLVRTTLSIDDDVLAAAKKMAERQRLSVGEIISTLARRALLNQSISTSHRNGVPLLTRRLENTPVTIELVNELRDLAP